MKHENNKYPNLIPNSARSPEELREMGRKGGIKSGESRRRKREQQKLVKMIAQVILESPDVRANLAAMCQILKQSDHEERNSEEK